MNDSTTLQHTPLHSLHLEHDAKLVPFAGYQMPVNYPRGIIAEHLHTREAAGLFDVSHMGQIEVVGENVATALETLTPTDVLTLAPNRQRYALLTNADGGIIDDLMIQNLGAQNGSDRFMLVVNAACKQQDFEHLQQHLKDVQLNLLTDRALLALQGPAVATVLADLGHDLADMKFMHVRELEIDGVTCSMSRSGYSGEDGFELSLPADCSEQVARHLLAHSSVELIGLGARDSLRLEAGLCLYGHDITPTTTPIEAQLNWAISRARRDGGERAAGFPGADIILSQMPNNITRMRVGLVPDGRAPIREGAELVDAEHNAVGYVSSGGFSPSLGHPISMGYVESQHASDATQLFALVRNKHMPLTTAALPFVPANFYR